MNFLVLSRKNAIEFSGKEHQTPYIIISITDVNSENVVFKESSQLKGIVRLKFNDTDSEGVPAITSKDAKQIIDFVEEWKNHVELIVVHCEAGISRSSGVCAALMLWLNGDDTPVFDNAFYKPNMRCYRTILNEALKSDYI